jgi:hypothetical protein
MSDAYSGNNLTLQDAKARIKELESQVAEANRRYESSIKTLKLANDGWAETIGERDNWRKIAEGLAKSATAMRIALSDIYRDGHTVRIQLTKAGALNHEVVGLLITAAGRDYGDMEAQSAYNKAKAEAGDELAE